MTANMIKGRGFRGALRYNLEKVEKGVAEVLSHSFVEVSEKMIMKEIQIVRMLKPNLQKYFYHTSINFPPSENLSNERMNEIGNEYLKSAGFDQHQFILFRHRDAEHPHLHILVNRISYDGKVLSDSNDFARTEKILRELEMRYNLKQVISSKQALKRAVTKDELEMMKRTQSPSHKTQLQKIVNGVMSTKPRTSCSEFIQALQKHGIDVRFNVASTRYVSGVSYSYKNMIVTGSKLGNDFKWTTLKNKLDYDQERDSAIIQQTNSKRQGTRAKSATNFKSKIFNNITSQSSESRDLRSLLNVNKFGDSSLEHQADIHPESELGFKHKRLKRKKRLRR